MTVTAFAAMPSERVLVRVAVAFGAVLATADLLSLWASTPQDEPSTWVIFAGALGAGFGVAAGGALLRLPRTMPAQLFLGASQLMLLGPLLAAVGAAGAGVVAFTAGFLVLVPYGLLAMVERPRAHRKRRAWQALHVFIVASGVGTVALLAAASVTSAILVGLACAVGLVAAGWWQFETTSGAARRQLLWVILGVCGSAASASLVLLAADTLPVRPAAMAVLASLLSLSLPACVSIALLAPDGRDVRSVISHVVLGAVMLTLAAAVFAVGASAVGWLAGGRPAVGLLGVVAAVVAAGYHPVLVQARRTIDELLFGGRADPLRTLTRLGDQLTSQAAPQEWLATLRSALGVQGLVLRAGDAVLASVGQPGEGPTVSLPLPVGDTLTGELVVALSPDQLQLRASTRAVLQLVAAPLAQALHAVQLTEQLRRSQGRVVGVLEEERRRMRRDLHDGLGPTLTGVAYTADAVANLITPDPAQASALLRQLREDVSQAIGEIRRIVYGLRPRALDELGLIAAVAQQTQRLRSRDGRPFAVSIIAPALPELPAAVEVIAYRVAVEAVTNVARHARVDRADVQFVMDRGVLQIVVRDSGSLATQWSEGVGITSMRERVEQIGGLLEPGPGPGGGVVRARLPLPISTDRDPRPDRETARPI